MYQLVPENQVQFGKVLSESLSIFWRHRSLWVASIIAGLLGQGQVSPSLNVSQSQPFPQTKPGEIPDFQKVFGGTIFADFIRNPIPYLVIGGAIWLLWLFVTLVFGSWATGALICMVDEIDQSGSTSLGSGWRLAQQRLWALIRLRLVVMLPMILAVVLLMVTMLPFWLRMMRILLLPPDQMEQAMQGFDPGSFGAFFCVIPIAVCVFLPATLILAAIAIFAERACLLDRIGVRESFRRGWQILRKQIGYSILAWVMMFFVNIVSGVVLLVPILPYWWTTAQRFFSEGFSSDIFPNFVVIFVYMVIVSLTLGALVSGWTSVFWTKLYKAFIGGSNESPALSQQS